MDLKLCKLQLAYYNFSYKAPLIKIFLLATVMAAIPCFNLLRQIEMINRCDWRVELFGLTPPAENFTLEQTRTPPTNLTIVFQKLLIDGWLRRGDRAVCVGPGAAAAVAVMRRLGVTCGWSVGDGGVDALPFPDNSSDFVYSEALDRVRVPARLVLEMERVLRLDGKGVVLRQRAATIATTSAASVINAAAPVSSFLRFSDVVAVRLLSESVAVVFQKRVGPTARTKKKKARPKKLRRPPRPPPAGSGRAESQ